MKNNNPHPIYTGLSLVLIVGAVASCDDSGTELACESGEHICIENSAQCENGNTELCLPDENMCLKWTLAPTNILNCEKCDSQCEADKTTCQNGLLRKCVVNSEGCNTWSDYGLCSEDTCNNKCQNGESKCDNGQLMKCVIDSQGCYAWSEHGQCPENICINECQNGESKCDNGQLMKCVIDSQGCYTWSDYGLCSEDTCNNECANLEESRCFGKRVQRCQLGENGCLEWQDSEVCPVACYQSTCQSCTQSCTIDDYRCTGKTLQKCVQNGDCTNWKDIKSCTAHCNSDSKTCSEDLPTCTLKSGSKATILQWTDGDTLWVRAVSDGTCNDYEYVADKSGNYAWRNVRYNIRVEGIDAPECNKSKNNYHYYVCNQDTNYNNENERYGYESWKAATEMLPYMTEVIITCDNKYADGTCKFDRTQTRKLAYIGFSKDNASYDFSTELARKGLAFANVEFANTTTLIGQVCKAQKEAIQSKTGLWSLASSVNGVLGKMGNSKQKNLKNLEARCEKYIK